VIVDPTPCGMEHVYYVVVQHVMCCSTTGTEQVLLRQVDLQQLPIIRPEPVGSAAQLNGSASTVAVMLLLGDSP
jgi:hypothetical protein